jgi:hypothetical protein
MSMCNFTVHGADNTLNVVLCLELLVDSIWFCQLIDGGRVLFACCL